MGFTIQKFAILAIAARGAAAVIPAQDETRGVGKATIQDCSRVMAPTRLQTFRARKLEDLERLSPTQSSWGKDAMPQTLRRAHHAP